MHKGVTHRHSFRPWMTKFKLRSGYVWCTCHFIFSKYDSCITHFCEIQSYLSSTSLSEKYR